MATIVALQEGSGKGKTSTIGILYGMMQRNGYDVVQDKKRKKSHDFFAIVQKNGKKVGITSYGDKTEILDKHLNYFAKLGCEVIVCACRITGPIKNYVQNFPAYSKQFESKTIANGKANQENANKHDALHLLSIVDGLV